MSVLTVPVFASLPSYLWVKQIQITNAERTRHRNPGLPYRPSASCGFCKVNHLNKMLYLQSSDSMKTISFPARICVSASVSRRNENFPSGFRSKRVYTLIKRFQINRGIRLNGSLWKRRRIIKFKRFYFREIINECLWPIIALILCGVLVLWVVNFLWAWKTFHSFLGTVLYISKLIDANSGNDVHFNCANSRNPPIRKRT